MGGSLAITPPRPGLRLVTNESEGAATSSAADMDTPEWRRHVNDEIVGIKKQLVIGGQRFDGFNREIQANTKITAETRDEFRVFAERARPTLDITEPMLRGAALVGSAVNWLHRWGARFARIALWGFGLWVGFKVFIAGGGWAEAIKAFMGVTK